mmetsp:Transcript_27918/g.41391  ORF Transcript_27918/g.41391 Transcript_27918/m.41391 type:complete len:568 (-) Transcript_27918:151-1854(-)
MLHEVDNTAGVSPLIVIPSDELDKVRVEHDTSLSIEDAGAGVSLEIGGNKGLVRVSKESLHLSLRHSLNVSTDLLVGGSLLKLTGKINNRNVNGRNTECHTGELSKKGRHNLGYSLSSSGGGGDDVSRRSTSSAPVLTGRGINNSLGSGHSMNSGHECLSDNELVVDSLNHGCKTVGGTGCTGDEILRSIVLVLVDSHNNSLGIILSRSRVDDLLSSSINDGLSGLLGEEDSGGLTYVVSSECTPADLLRVTATGSHDLLSVKNEEISINLYGSLSDSVDGIVLVLVSHVVGGSRSCVDSVQSGVLVFHDDTGDKTSNTSESIDTNSDRLERFLTSIAVDNISKFWLEGSSSNKESINIRLSRKSSSSSSSCRSSVKNTGLLSNLSSCNFSEVLTDSLVGILSLLGGSSQTSSNRPDGFVSNYNILPVLLGENISISLDLGKDILVGGSSLTSLKGLSAACHNLESLIKRILGLGCNFSITLSLSTTLRVSAYSPANSHISKHISRGFSGVSSISLYPNILCSYSNILAKLLSDSLNVYRGRAYDDLGVGGEGGLVEHGNEIVCLLN